MWRIKRKVYRKNRYTYKNEISEISQKNRSISENQNRNFLIDATNIQNEFVLHMSKHIGETVIIFVNGGGMSGAGFTGVLLRVHICFIQLITKIATPPMNKSFNFCIELPNCDSSKLSNLQIGSIANIPIDKIISFVHYTL
jgi:hypothetical protein